MTYIVELSLRPVNFKNMTTTKDIIINNAYKKECNFFYEDSEYTKMKGKYESLVLLNFTFLTEKNIVHKNNVDLHKIKIENEQENFTILKIPKEISKGIAEARNLKKITQKDMANRLNIQKDIINNIENGKANYDPSTKENINKIQKFLGIKLKKIKK